MNQSLEPLRLPIYMDNLATTPVDPRVLQAMLPYLTEHFGNAASRTHAFGLRAAEAVEHARLQAAGLIGAEPEEIVFTSGATESDNLAILGVAEAMPGRGRHVITAATEHKAVLDTCLALEARGWQVTALPVDRYGLVDPGVLKHALTGQTALISIMLANNEIGVLQPIPELADTAHRQGALFHTDAAQAVGKVPVNANELGVDLLSFTAHKMYGPKGIGALFVRRGVPLSIQMHGGGHEENRRSGTLNVPGIVALGQACALAADLLESESTRLAQLRDRLRDGLLAALPEVTVNGDPSQRLPGNLHLSFAGVDGEALIAGVRDVALSAGAACTSGSVRPSHVLKAIGASDLQARSSVRFGLGRFNTVEEVDFVIERVIDTVERLRELSPLWDAA